ncbi:MAG: hypothetical protein AAGC53_22740, partial [Actinomycetota bacterium]
MNRRRFRATFVALALVAGACQQSDGAGDATPASTSTTTTSAGSSTSTTTTPSTTTTTPEPAEHPAAPNGRRYPAVPDTGAAVAARLVEVE